VAANKVKNGTPALIKTLFLFKITFSEITTMYKGGIRIITKSKPIIMFRVNSKTLGEVSVIIAIKKTPKTGSNRTKTGTIFLRVIICRNFCLSDMLIF